MFRLLYKHLNFSNLRRNALRVIFAILTLTTFFSSIGFSQTTKNHNLQLYVNPFVLKMGNLPSQYSSLTNEQFSVDYNKPLIFQTGIDYTYTSNKWSFIVGLSQMTQQQAMNFSFPPPYSSDYYLENLNRTLNFSSNFIGLKLGTSRQLAERIRINVSLNYFTSVTRKSRIRNFNSNTPFNLSNLYFDFSASYDLQTPDGIESVRTEIYYDLFEQKYNPFLLPEISVDYALTSNFLLNLGFRSQFWSNPENYRFRFEVEGYINSPNENEEIKPLHSSRITPQGYYVWLGLKYEIPILTQQKSTE
jgi:hypothetical protein